MANSLKNLRTEREIRQNWQGASLSPLVSICCITYNHEKYIGDAIEGFLMQKTDFPTEILIYDDASTDKTSTIISDYESRYPNLIKPLYQIQNQYSQGKKPNLEFNFPRAKGKYIAMCEGDDYWTDPFKLQKQVDFLERNQDFAICFHNMQIVDEDNPHLNHISNINQQKITTIENLAHLNYIYTASCIFRNNLYKIPEWFDKCPIGDYPLHLLNAQYGKIKFIDELMGVYRIHKGGIWEIRDWSYRMEKMTELLNIIKDKFNEDINQILNNQLYYSYFQLSDYYYKNKNYEKHETCLMKILDGKPTYLIEIIKSKTQENFMLEQMKSALQREIKRIKSTISWHITKPLRFFTFIFHMTTKYFNK